MNRGIDNLRNRINYYGGPNAEIRMQKDKLRTLKKALLYSYQAETIILEDGREFRCLINTDKTKPDYDIKIISIPYEDICLGKINEDGIEEIYKPDGKTSNGIEKIGLKCGDTFKWKETDTYWLVYLEMLEENAYFRAEIQKCEEEVTINGKKYHIYVRGPVETVIQWRQKQEVAWNDINYSLIIYIKKDENTLDYFHRFKQIKVNNRNYEVKVVDPYSADGIIEVCLGEYFENELNDIYIEEQKKKDAEASAPANKKVYIDGPKIVYPYDVHKYVIHGLIGGNWEIDNFKKAKFDNVSDTIAIVNFISGKSGKINLRYTTDNDEVTLPIEIRSI